MGSVEKAAILVEAADVVVVHIRRSHRRVGETKAKEINPLVDGIARALVAPMSGVRVLDEADTLDPILGIAQAELVERSQEVGRGNIELIKTHFSGFLLLMFFLVRQ